MSLLSCDLKFHSICLTHYQVHNATEVQQQFDQYLEGTWSDKFFNYSVLLRENIANENRVSVLFPDAGFLGKVWENIKKLFDPLWIATYVAMGGIVHANNYFV